MKGSGKTMRNILIILIAISAMACNDENTTSGAIVPLSANHDDGLSETIDESQIYLVTSIVSCDPVELFKNKNIDDETKPRLTSICTVRADCDGNDIRLGDSLTTTQQELTKGFTIYSLFTRGQPVLSAQEFRMIWRRVVIHSSNVEPSPVLTEDINLYEGTEAFDISLTIACLKI